MVIHLSCLYVLCDWLGWNGTARTMEPHVVLKYVTVSLCWVALYVVQVGIVIMLHCVAPCRVAVYVDHRCVLSPPLLY